MPLLQSFRLGAMEQALYWVRGSAIRQARNSARAAHLLTGELGELRALFFLRRHGYVVVARRWRNIKQPGDLDLIAWEGNTLCFVEVKTRGSREVATAESSVNEDKRKTLRRLARLYIKSVVPAPESIRFDLLSIYLDDELQEPILFRAAFGW